MNRFFVVALTLCLGILSAAGQSTTVTIKGKVVDKADGSPLIGAFIKLNAADTVGLKKSGRMVASSENGAFTIISHEKKSDITISYLGYAPIKIDIPAGKKLVELGNINLIEEGRQIGAVVVTGKATMGKNEADTIQYNAAAFKTNPDGSAEDLLKKMPGVTTDESGNVQSQGQKIAKVMVNGKEYFDDDPAMALKNLPVDAVESMQMYDDQSEQSKFSGFDDGQRVRTLNIVTKKGVMNSTFGKVYAGYGLNGQYTAGAGVNMMRDNHRITIVAQSNNVNNQGFTLNDIGQGASGGRGRMGGGGNNAGAFTTSSRGGIMQTNMAAINYNGQFAEKLKLSASYSFSGRSADQVSTRKQNYLVQPRYYQQGASSLGYEYQHRLFARAEWSPNQANKITFTPRVNYALNHGISTNVSSTSTAKEGTLTNSSKNSYDTKYESYDLSGDLWWQTRLGKAGRVLSLGTVLSGKKNWGDRYQNSLYGSLDDASAWVPDSLKQRGYIDGSEYTITGSATYTEPLSKRSRLSANYTINHNKSMSNRE
ncbi:MAG: carboxypeptidase-like regulatory domain-containing protein, partial [Mucinivorans sp.]